MTQTQRAAGHHWWERATIYQIYPRSFMDGDGDGIGDLPGVIARLDYLVALGIDTVWLSPIFPSPMADFGYDVADYCNVDPMFGTLADFDRLVAAAHTRGLRLLLDYVPNHTSDRHPWFMAARSSRNDPQRDWYIWRDAARGGPPNNWRSHFGGDAWAWDAATGQYYLHSFLREQPDLNWRNPAVRAAMYDVLRFWLERGVDGFRVDVLWLLIKDDAFRDNPLNPQYVAGQSSYEALIPLYSADRPEVHTIVAEMRAVLDAYGDRVLIGEVYLPFDRLVAYYGSDGRGAQLPFNFALIFVPWDAASVAAVVRAYEAALPPGGWPNWVLGNHDRSRIASRVGSAQARIAAMLLLTLRGTPTLYYGDELGLTDVPIPPDRVADPAEKNQPGIGVGRDPERTPMPWDDSPHYGFTTGTPWLPTGDRDDTTVAVELHAPDSLLALYRRLIALRRERDVLVDGPIGAVVAEYDVLRYERGTGDERLIIALNLGAHARTVTLPPGRIVLATTVGRDGEVIDGILTLRANEAAIVEPSVPIAPASGGGPVS